MNKTPLRADLFRLLGDPVRLRILRLLAGERLNVSELTRILGLAQSGTSRHVRLLREGGLVAEEREGGWTWLALAGAAPPGLEALWDGLVEQLAAAPDEVGDDARLEVVRREREERRIGWASRPAEPGRSWEAWARGLGHLLPALDVADLGCGGGALTLELARWARRVVAVDPHPARIEQARARADAAGAANVTFHETPLDDLVLDDDSVDVALLSQVLHECPLPPDVVAEAVRILRPGGRVLLLDLLPHDEVWVRERLGHRHLGFDPSTVTAWLRDAGLQDVRVEEAARRRGNPFTVLVASGCRPNVASQARGPGAP